MFLLAVFLMLGFSVFWRIIRTNFFHCLNVDAEKLWQKAKIQYDGKEMQHGMWN